MHKKRLVIRNIGPIDQCSFDLNKFNIITGKQSSGKSTIAKVLFFFLDIKDLLRRLAFDYHHPGVYSDGKGDSLNKQFRTRVKNSFMEIFDETFSTVRKGTFIRMYYTDSLYIQISVNDSLTVSYCNELRDFINSIEREQGNSLERSFNIKIFKKIDDIFEMDYSPVYIPAGRSLTTILGDQFGYFYSTLDDRNRRLIDLCSRRYYETVMHLKPLFKEGLEKLSYNKYSDELLFKSMLLMNSVIDGEYHYTDGQEYLELKNGQKVRFNRASSGQQEALWIYNILLCFSLLRIKKFYIIEEPESNLFPESQQYISKFLGLISNQGNQMLINTHSPYILGELNNMIYAGILSVGKKKKAVNEIIDKDYQLTFEETIALFVDDGKVHDCMDYEIKQIDNSKLDSISSVINEEYDQLIEIERG